MKQIRSFLLISSLALACGLSGPLRAVESDATPTVTATDAATQKHVDAKVDHLLGSIKFDDAGKAARAKSLLGGWIVTIWNWHKVNDPQLKELWSKWNQARAVVPKDEFPAEVIAHQIDDAYASLKPAYQTFIAQLSAELSPEQVDAIKEKWSRSPGRMRTYNVYLQMVPDLNDEQKKVIFDRMNQAREDAMLTDADREIVTIFKRHKVKVEAYIGTLEWAKLHAAFANKGK
ncbi:MAG TPA: DUF3826 domain-containing protein [Lacunisphaera sp.]|jgi:predicted small lipoprotein YifL